MKKEPMSLTPQALGCLMNYPWPGNVRELENEVKRLVVSVTRKTITAEDLSESIRNSIGRRPASKLQPRRSLKETVAEPERRMILEALRGFRQNQQQAVKALGLNRQGLIKKMKRYSIKSCL